MTSTQPYRGRHSAPEPEPWHSAPAQPQDASPIPQPPATQPPATQLPVPQLPVPQLPAPQLPAPGIADQPVASAPWAAFNYEPTLEPLDGWPAPAPAPAPLWEQPGGFVPLAAPARGGPRLLRTGALVLAVALIGALAWLGYAAFSTDSPPPAPQPAAAAAGTVSYTSAAGHFDVTLSADPVTSTSTVTENGFHMKSVLAAVPADHEVVGSLQVSPAVPTEEQTALMRGFLNGMAHGASVTDLVAGSYLGRPGLSATVPTTSGTASVQIVAYSATRLYFLVAGNAADLTSLKGSFRPTA